MSRRYLIAVSIVAHLAIAAGVFVSGVWRIERIDYDHRFLGGIAVMVPTPPPPAPAGGTKPDDPTPPKRPQVKAKGPTQPDTHVERHDTSTSNTNNENIGPGDPSVIGTCLENCGPETAPPTQPVCGNGTLEVGETCDDGNTAAGDGCSATCQTEPKRAVPPPTVPPTALKRISGNTDLHPTDIVKSRMLRDEKTAVKANLKICVAADGTVTSAAMIGSTGYPEYDATLVAGARGWRYQPVTINGVAQPACSAVTFLYHME